MRAPYTVMYSLVLSILFGQGSKVKLLLIGGDGRMRTACEELKKEGFLVQTLGLYPGDGGNPKEADVLLLPVPTTRDGRTVFAPFADREILLSEVEAAGDPLILTCGYDFGGKRCVDYGKLDSYALYNAVPTAEGAIRLAIGQTGFTLWKSRVLVIGYGRVGKVLCHRLCALGCEVTVSARKESDLALCEVLGFRTVKTGEVAEILPDCDIVFNTVDAPVIGEKALAHTNATLMIDLSTKGGFDLKAAKKAGITALKAPGLPGKIAPVTAGRILAKTVTDILKRGKV